MRIQLPAILTALALGSGCAGPAYNHGQTPLLSRSGGGPSGTWHSGGRSSDDLAPLVEGEGVDANLVARVDASSSVEWVSMGVAIASLGVGYLSALLIDDVDLALGVGTGFYSASIAAASYMAVSSVRRSRAVTNILGAINTARWHRAHRDLRPAIIVPHSGFGSPGWMIDGVPGEVVDLVASDPVALSLARRGQALRLASWLPFGLSVGAGVTGAWASHERRGVPPGDYRDALTATVVGSLVGVGVGMVLTHVLTRIGEDHTLDAVAAYNDRVYFEAAGGLATESGG